MSKKILENVKTGDSVTLYTLKGDQIQGVVTMKNDEEEFLVIRKSTENSESRYAYALIIGSEVTTSANLPTERLTTPQPVSNTDVPSNFAEVRQIAQEEGIYCLPEWVKIDNRYQNAAKIGEFAKKYNRIGLILAELFHIKEKFRNPEQYERVYGFFKGLEDTAEIAAKSAKEQKSATLMEHKPEKSTTKPSITYIPSNTRTAAKTTEKAEVTPTTKSSPEIAGVVFKAISNRYYVTRCHHWLVRTKNGKTYWFKKNHVTDSALLDTLKEKFKKNEPISESVQFQLLEIVGKFGQPRTFANKVRRKTSYEVVDEELEAKHRKAFEMIQSGKEHDAEALPLLLECFKADPHNDATAKNICTVYIRSGEPLKAVEFVEDAKCLTEEERLNIKYEAYRKAGQPEKAFEAEKGIIACTQNYSHKAHHLLYAIGYTYGRQDYAEALRYCEQWLAIDIGKNAAKSVARALQRSNVCKYAAGCVVRLEGAGEKFALSPKLEKAIEVDENATAIRFGKTPPITIEVTTGKTDDSTGDAAFPPLPGLENIGIIAKGLLEEIDVSIPPKVISHKITTDEKGRFLGAPDSVIKIVKALTDDVTTKKQNERFVHCIYAARILYDAIQGGDATDGLEDEMFFQLTRALASKGDESLRAKPDYADISRFYYTEAIRYAGANQDRQNAVTRCVLSVFADKKTIQDTMVLHKDENLVIRKIAEHLDKLCENLNDKLLFGVLSRIINNDQIQKTETQEDLVDAILASKQAANIAQDLFSAVDETYSGNVTSPAFNKALDTFRKRYADMERSFVRFTERMKDMRFQREWIEDTRRELDGLELFFGYTDAVDQENCQGFTRDLLDRAERVYNARGLFDEQETALKVIHGRINEQIHKIKEIPAYYSYERLLNVLKAWDDASKQELGDLYAKHPPSITCEINGANMATMDEDGFVKIFMEISNQKGRQSADEVSVTIIVDDRCAYELENFDEGKSRTIKGGEKKDVYAILKMRDKGFKAFPAFVHIKYRYKGKDDETLEGECPVEIPVAFGENRVVDMDNPYSNEVEASGMTNRDLMFGRAALISKQIGKLRGDGAAPLKGKTLLLYGQKRAGKTTVLQYLAEDMEKEVPDAIIVKFGDIIKAEPLEGASFELRFYKKVFDLLDHEISTRHPTLAEALRNAGIDIPKGESIMDTADGHDKMQSFFTRMNWQMKSQEELTRKRVVILIDEFTRLYGWFQQGLLIRSFMQYWKAMISEYGIVAIVVAQDYFRDFKKEFPNSFGAIEDIQVDYLTRDAVEEMIREPFKKIAPWGAFPEKNASEAIDRIVELTAGSAYFTMIFLDRLVRYMNANNQSFVIRQIVDMVLQEEILGGNDPLSVAKFDSLYNDASDISDTDRKAQNLAVLWRIALYHNERKSSCPKAAIQIPDDVTGSSGMTPERVSQLVDRLHERGVLIKEDGRDEYYIRVGMFREWLVKKCGVDTINALPKDDLQGERV